MAKQAVRVRAWGSKKQRERACGDGSAREGGQDYPDGK